MWFASSLVGSYPFQPPACVETTNYARANPASRARVERPAGEDPPRCPHCPQPARAWRDHGAARLVPVFCPASRARVERPTMWYESPMMLSRIPRARGETVGILYPQG